jgi:hypothetical protein
MVDIVNLGAQHCFVNAVCRIILFPDSTLISETVLI